MLSREELEGVRGFIAGMIERTGLALRAAVDVRGEELLVNLSGSDRAYLLTDEGETLLSLQYLFAKMIRQKFPEACALFVLVDSDGYMFRHEESLRRLASHTIARVRRERRGIRLRPMNPYDRRIVHMEVGRYVDLDSCSEGEGFFKSIVVRKKR